MTSGDIGKEDQFCNFKKYAQDSMWPIAHNKGKKTKMEEKKKKKPLDISPEDEIVSQNT